MTKESILAALRAFIESRPGFDPANYQGAPQVYRADYRRAYRHLQDARAMLRAVEWRDSIAGDDIVRAKHHRVDFIVERRHECACGHKWMSPVSMGITANLSGEMTHWCPKCHSRPAISHPHEARIDYCVSGYYPTEYRGAACATLAGALWDYFRDKCGCETGDDIRTMARRELGSALARRWFR